MRQGIRGERATRGAAIVWLIAAVAALAVGGFLIWGDRDEAATTEIALSTTAAREKLRVAVIEAGQLKAARSTDIYCKVRGGATILELVDEGTWIKEGDTVVKLDAKSLEDDLTAQKIKYQNALAAKIQAEKAREIQASKNQSDIDKANLDLALAKTDLEKYVNGDFPLKQKQAESDQKLAASEEQTAKTKAEDTAELVELDYAAETEKQSDELAHQRAKVKLEMSIEQGKLLETYEKPRQMQVLESDVRQKESELDRVRLRCEADIAQKTADEESKKATYQLEKSKLAELEEQLKNTTIHAPAAGLVVYPVNQSGGMGGRGGSDRDRVEEGATARENQLLLSLPDTSEMVVSVSIHESAMDKVRVGQPALVTIDAIKEKSYFGKVTFMAPLPDSANQWLNPDLKVYRCEITLDGDMTGLRPGMSASAEIIVDELLDVVALPIHAVYRRGQRYFVYVADSAGKPQVREVKIGLHNEQRVAVLEGIDLGAKVFLSVPPGAPEPDFPVETKVAAETSMEELRQRAAAIQPKSGAAPATTAPGAGGPPGGAPGAAPGAGGD
ncbi:MAG: HlyD family efflux transporter periplasmic adaptor subunit, partial [Planctomycetes bacterium]|nr:HlyD family efflux transporter periplasmic adaptor subunit [Planctomycetota bacterium]